MKKVKGVTQEEKRKSRPLSGLAKRRAFRKFTNTDSSTPKDPVPAGTIPYQTVCP